MILTQNLSNQSNSLLYEGIIYSLHNIIYLRLIIKFVLLNNLFSSRNSIAYEESNVNL